MGKLHRVLVVDGSRVVRATLRKHLQDDFDVVEENDGESAWQALMLDADIKAVISGVHTPKLEARDLMARLKGSVKSRLREMPFVLIVSDIENQSERDLDSALGVRGFITKTMKKAEIVACISGALEAEIPIPGEEHPEPEKTPNEKMSPSHSRTSKAVKAAGEFIATLEACSIAGADKANVSVLVLAIDNIVDLYCKFGDDVAGMIAPRFANLLLTKVGAEDLIGHCGDDRLAILSHGVNLEEGLKFAKRVCRSLASGQISIRGERIRLTASIGVASTSHDAVVSAVELLELAGKRADQARVCGGNTVAIEFKKDCPLHSGRKLPSEVNSLWDDDNLEKNVGVLGLKFFPLIQAINKELQLDLPLSDIRRRLEQRAGNELPQPTLND